MLANLITRASIGLLPVALFLAALLYFDSYKLVRLKVVLVTIVAGAIAAGASYLVNMALLGQLTMELVTYSRYVAPFVEEILKSLIIVYLIRSSRIGFPVDAAIFGFATGTGFAMIENVYYLGLLPDAHIAVWIVRGFGTAIMHGGATAILAIVAHTLAEERQKADWLAFAPGFLVAVIIHSAFNHFLFAPVLSTLGILVVLPPVIYLVFQLSEKILRRWLAMDFDADTELLELINSGEFSESKVGKYLASVRDRFKGEVIVDMLCYLRLNVELSMRANGILMMRESGFEVDPGENVEAMLQELEYLEKSIGRTGRQAMKPILQLDSRDLWQLYMLGK